MPMLLLEVLPQFALEIEQLLKEDEPALSAQVRGLRMVDCCRCGDGFCATFYTERPPKGAYGPGHRNVVLEPSKGMLVLDVIGSQIVCVEVLYREEIRRALHVALP